MKKWLYAAAGFLVLVGLGILAGPSRGEAKARGQRDELILEGSGRAKAKAHKKGIVADGHQRNAVVAAEVGQKIMDKAGENESTADLLDSWRKPVTGL